MPLVVAHTILDVVSFVGYAFLHNRLSFLHSASACGTPFRTLFSLATAVLAAAPPTVAHAAAGAAPTALYIVQTAGDPAATYAGGVSGIPETAPVPGHRLDPHAWNYQAYRDYLRRQHSRLARAAGLGAPPVVEYTTVFNGFAAELTVADAARLRATTGVLALYKSRMYATRTATTPGFLGLDGAGGVWDARFGDPGHAGQGVIVGDIDSGYWPENPSFAALPGPRADQPAIDRKWGTGDTAAAKCQHGDDHPVTCNDKVIGAAGSTPVGSPRRTRRSTSRRATRTGTARTPPPPPPVTTGYPP